MYCIALIRCVLVLRCGSARVVWLLRHSWIKIDQLDVTCFIISLFTAQHVSNVSTSIFRCLRLNVDLFHVMYCSGSMCVGVTVWFGWGGVVSLCRLQGAQGYHLSQWPRGLRFGFAAARMLRMRARIPPGHGSPSVVSVVCCQLEVSATSWSLAERSPTDCGASLCVI